MTTTDERPPLPPFTDNQAVIERRADNILEAHAIVTTHLGPIDALSPLQAIAAGSLAVAIADALQVAEDRGTAPRLIPELLLVSFEDLHPDGGHRTGDTRGLQCPHCGHVTWDGDEDGVYVIDVDERWSRFGFEISMVPELEEVRYENGATDSRRTGREVEQLAVHGWYGDSEHHGVGYACYSCSRRVALPEGVEEVGD